jgi:hypothetical protein
MRRLTLPAVLLVAACIEPVVTKTNDAPVVVIQRPGDGAVFGEGESVEFVGKVVDDRNPEDVEIVWLDNGVDVLLDGVFPDSEGLVTFTTADLSVGSHAVTLRGTDADNATHEASVNVEIEEVAELPIITINSPVSGDRAEVETDFQFSATVTDPQDASEDLVVEVISDVDSLVCVMSIDGTGEAVCAGQVVTVGPHRITFEATDLDGNTAQKSVQLIADPVREEPFITVLSPAAGGSQRFNTAFELAAQVEDRQDIAQNLQVRVVSDLEGDICPMLVDSAGIASCFGTLSQIGFHRLTFSVMDLDGNTTDSVVLISVADGTDIDDDGDGQTENQGDCDDGAVTVFAGAPELEDGIDNDCDGIADEGTSLVDDDGDGYCESVAQPCTDGAAPGDCNDATASINPGITESCNGFDDDCDNTIDEPGASGCTTYYIDNDLDGYGDPATESCVCTAPANAVQIGGDCNDAAFLVNPSVSEVADGFDNNCNNIADEGTSRYDNDGDGFCADSSCTPQPTGTPTGGDCNDTNPSVNPGAAEVCANGVDDNCNNTQNEGENAIGCTTFYPDNDGDFFGGPNGRCFCQATGNFALLDNEDCDDANASAKPGQTAWFNSPRSNGSYDYNCDGVSTRQFDASYDCGCPQSTLDPEPFSSGWESGTAGCGQSRNFVTQCSYSLSFNVPNPLWPLIGPRTVTECLLTGPDQVVTRQQQCR